MKHLILLAFVVLLASCEVTTTRQTRGLDSKKESYVKVNWRSIPAGLSGRSTAVIDGYSSSDVAKITLKTNCSDSTLDVLPASERWEVELSSPSTLCVPLRLSIRAYSDTEMKNVVDSLSYQVGHK